MHPVGIGHECRFCKFKFQEVWGGEECKYNVCTRCVLIQPVKI